MGPGNGILSVDGVGLPSGSHYRIYVARGKREIGYSCPDWVVTDGPLTVDGEFEPGKAYRLVCGSSDPEARLISDPGHE